MRETVPHITYLCSRGWLAKKRRGECHKYLNHKCACQLLIPKFFFELTSKPPTPTLEIISQDININESFNKIPPLPSHPMVATDEINGRIDELLHEWILLEPDELEV
jgi:hypothetical protein